MAVYIAEKVCAGKHNFRPGDEVELKPAEAKDLVADGALRLRDEVKKKPEAKTATKPTTKPDA